MTQGTRRGEGRIHDAIGALRPGPIDRFAPAPHAEHRLVAFERAVADEEADEIAFGLAILSRPFARAAMIMQDDAVAGFECAGLSPFAG